MVAGDPKNRSLDDILSEPNIIGEIKSARILWLGHLQRMPTHSAAIRAYIWRPRDRGPVGRTKCQWKDEVE